MGLRTGQRSCKEIKLLETYVVNHAQRLLRVVDHSGPSQYHEHELLGFRSDLGATSSWVMNFSVTNAGIAMCTYVRGSMLEHTVEDERQST